MIVLGSTGSIGQNTLSLASDFDLGISALACKQNYKLLNEQIKKFAPKLVYIANSKLKEKVDHNRIFCGDIKEFLLACASECEASKTTLVNAFVGFSGLLPSRLAQDLGFKLALANKESLVAGGNFLNCDEILPIDSEHFGLRFLLQNAASKPNKLIITASGGACRKLKVKQIVTLKIKHALRHPNWNMGAKITIDSSTMINKLFEVLEAFHLFKIDKIEAFIEKTSAVHALIEFIDGSTTAHLSKTDMRLAIAHALGIKEPILKPLNLLDRKIEFYKIDLKKYPVFALKDELLKDSKKGVIINAANDVMVAKYLNKECKFGDISKNILKTYESFCKTNISSFDDVLELDKKIREYLR